ncbi:protein of unknown function UPF0236 [Thermoanaerobacter wiegelii Rt8.B1]|uniref:Uncharacterized protein n=1 Tax=Thermoanaerobacter wiegelii Rt8.B1 TaxID=697303 RepID=G2MRJ3_9THEO|nr:protein of unknown function UPF0236 [Thermoanaerobacter wiegelii Rt8.B1]
MVGIKDILLIKRRELKRIQKLQINNITVLNMGKITPIYRILKAIKYERVI